MEIASILSTGVQGLQQATSRANQAAQDIASQQVTDTNSNSDKATALRQNDLTTSLVELKQAEIDAKANVKVVEVGSDLVGSLLDITV